MRILLVVMMLLCYTQALFSQSYSKEWQVSLSYHSIDSNIPTNGLFSNTTGLDTFSLIRPMSFGYTCVTMSDFNGDLQFYTNGIWLANRNHDTLFNSNNYNPGWASTYYSPWGMPYMQYIVALPHSDSTNLYHIFSQSANLNIPGVIYVPERVSYSLIDMNLDNGRGGITSVKDSTIVSDTLNNGHMTACRHGNGRDWWIISHKYNSNLRHKILVSPNGPILESTQSIGTSTPDILDWYGQACFSPDGTKYAIALARTGSVELFDFDRCTGVLSNPRIVYINDSTAGLLGVSFSPDSRFLYTSSSLYLYQLDTWAANLINSMMTVGIYDGYVATFETKFFYHQLAVDGVIYLSTIGGDSVLHKIAQPDSLGLNCDFQQHFMKLSYFANKQLNNFPNYTLGPFTGSPCDTLQSVNESIQNAPLQLNVFPNPVVEHNVSINYTLEQNKKGFLEIMDITGKIVYEQTLPQWSTMQQIILSKLDGGVYLVRLRSGIKEAITKLVLIDD